MKLLFTLGLLALISAFFLFIAWIFGLWLPMLIVIAVVLVYELVWGEGRSLRERFANRNAKPS